MVHVYTCIVGILGCECVSHRLNNNEERIISGLNVNCTAASGYSERTCCINTTDQPSVDARKGLLFGRRATCVIRALGTRYETHACLTFRDVTIQRRPTRSTACVCVCVCVYVREQRVTSTRIWHRR